MTDEDGLAQASAEFRLACATDAARLAAGSFTLLRTKTMDDIFDLTCDIPPVAGRFTTLRLKITLGEPLPSKWRFAVFWPYGCSLPQVSRPQFAGYVTAKSRSGAEILLAPLLITEDWGSYEYERAIQIKAKCGPLPAGEILELVYGDTSNGSPGARASRRATACLPIACYRLSPEEGQHTPRLASPVVNVSSAAAGAVRGFTTSVLSRGERGTLKLVAEDKWGNRANDFVGKVRLAGVSGFAGLPDEVTFTPDDKGCRNLSFVAEQAGIHHPVVSGPFGDLEAGPVVVEQIPPIYRLYFGELHCHTELSYDAAGQLDEFYDFAEHTAGLDFAAATDHMTFAVGRPGYAQHFASFLDTAFENYPERWRLTIEAARRYHRPGQFVTFLGVEADTVGHPGHRNVYFLKDDIPPVTFPAWPPPQGFLAEWCKGKQVLVIPHHPPIWWSAGVYPGMQGLKYGDLAESIQPVVEIYSRHGASEYFNNPRPLRGQIPGYFIQDMLAAGRHFGFIGGSDSHQADPGNSCREGGPFKTLQYRSGLAAIWARNLSREALWEAIFARRVFATTYPRFVIKFYVNQLFMGEAGATSYPRRVSVWIASPVEINEVEVIRNNEVIHIFSLESHSPMPSEVEGEMVFEDKIPSGRTEDFYYVRVTTRSGERAWTSPIFAAEAVRHT